MNIKQTVFYLFALSFVLSCSSSRRKATVSKKSAREKYEEKVRAAAINSPAANAWLNAGEFSLNHPLAVSNVYAEEGNITKNDAAASAFSISVKRGQKLTLSFRKNDSARFKAYVDLWRAGDSLSRRPPAFIAAADTALNFIQYTPDADEKLVVRFQQEIGAAGGYELNIHTGPSFVFPIAANVKANIGSVWDDPRDGGARKYEGVDIFAPRHSPAVAVGDGDIVTVGESTLGGKYVFMQPYGSPYNVYYAHLDSQLVYRGQKVRAGQALGLTGNTGNAKYTASHLHFGVYASDGAIDPMMFIKQVKGADKKSISFPRKSNMATTKIAKFFTDISLPGAGVNLAKGTQVIILSATTLYYRVALADGRRGFVLKTSVK